MSRSLEIVRVALLSAMAIMSTGCGYVRYALTVDELPSFLVTNNYLARWAPRSENKLFPEMARALSQEVRLSIPPPIVFVVPTNCGKITFAPAFSQTGGQDTISTLYIVSPLSSDSALMIYSLSSPARTEIYSVDTRFNVRRLYDTNRQNCGRDFTEALGALKAVEVLPNSHLLLIERELRSLMPEGGYDPPRVFRLTYDNHRFDISQVKGVAARGAVPERGASEKDGNDAADEQKR